MPHLHDVPMGHLIAIRGYEDAPDPAVFIRDPASYSGRAITLPSLH